MDIRILFDSTLRAKQSAENFIKFTSWKGHDKYTGRWWFWASDDQNAPRFQSQNCIYCGNYILTNLSPQVCPANIRCTCMNVVIHDIDLYEYIDMDFEQLEADWQAELDFREGRREYGIH